jgi:hypothetical protein
MLTQTSYESKYVSTELRPPGMYYRPGCVTFPQLDPMWLTSFVPFHSGTIVHTSIDPPSLYPAVDEDDLAAAFGLVAIGEDEEGVTIFDFVRDVKVGCVASLQRDHEPWPDLGWGTHAISRRYPKLEEPWIKVVRRSTLRRKKLQQRRSRRTVERKQQMCYYMGVERTIAKPGSQHRDGGKHHKDLARRLRPRKDPVERRKRHRRRFDSTLGYPGEGPPKKKPVGKKVYRKAEPRKGKADPKRWEAAGVEVRMCANGRACQIKGHWHTVKKDPFSGATKRMAEGKVGRVKSPPQYKVCAAPTAAECESHEHGHDILQFVDDLSLPELSRLDGKHAAHWSKGDDATYYDPVRPEAPSGDVIDSDVMDLMSFALDGSDRDEREELPEHPSGKGFNYCAMCAKRNDMCDTPGDATNIKSYPDGCTDCLHPWSGHGVVDIPPKPVDSKYPLPDPSVKPLNPKKPPKPVIPPLPSVAVVPILPIPVGPRPPVPLKSVLAPVGLPPVVGPKLPPRPLLVPRVPPVVPPKPVKPVVFGPVPNVDPKFVVDIANPLTLIDRIIYLKGDEPQASCCNCCFHLLKHTPCVVQEDEFLVNDWRREFIAEVEELIPSYEPRLRFKWSRHLFGRQKRLNTTVQYLRNMYNMAKRAHVYGEMVRVLLARQEVRALTVVREDNTSVLSARKGVDWVLNMLTDPQGRRWADIWAIDATVYSNSIDAVINQMVRQDIANMLVLPGLPRVRPAFPSVGL